MIRCSLLSRTVAPFAVLIALTYASQAAEVSPPEGFEALFNGSDLTGWKGVIEKGKPQTGLSDEEVAAKQSLADKSMGEHWSVRDGEIVFDGQGESISTAKDYGDFELYVDWKLPPGGDSGLYLRGCPQIQIWDPAHEPYWVNGAENGSGGIWNNRHHSRFPIVKADRPIGEWNTFHITMIGPRVTVELNGQTVVDDVVMENFWAKDRPIEQRGPIFLQDHGNTLWFRNLFIREIPSEEANQRLKGSLAAESVFNGRDLTGWTGATENYEVIDGAIVCKPGKGGTLVTEKTYSDFVAELEFKLPPGGNNGLAIRYPGKGQPHIDGFCELQVLDSEHEKYTELHPTQYHGSAYGLVPAARGFLRPTGQWNLQQVTVVGSRIHVNLNGYTILNADLAEVTESKEGPVPPGVNVRTGHFGFAGHSDPVAFQNISIRELPDAPASPPNRDAAITPTEGPITVFNGKNLEGFYPWLQGSGYKDVNSVFTVQDGVLNVTGEGYGGLVTRDSYRDYHLVLEFRWGEKTWGERETRARDAGLLVHAWGPDGAFNDRWMSSVEAQIIEGGMGDILLLSASDPVTGRLFPTYLTADIMLDRDGEKVWKKGGDPVTVTEGRINWWGRDWNWTDTLGFRWREDVDSPLGEWTRLDVIAEGDKLRYEVNGVVVNEAYDVKPSSGKLLLQTEMAEWQVRKLELWPLGKAPPYQADNH